MTNLEILKNSITEWNGQIVENDTIVSVDTLDFTKAFSILLRPNKSVEERKPIHMTAPSDTPQPIQRKSELPLGEFEEGKEYQITVRSYMTKKSSPDFDFMLKFNDDVPMPLMTMVGYMDKQTKGMVHLNLRGVALPVVRCMRCGKTLSNPISRHYGLGVECIQRVGITYDIDDVENIKEAMVNITWSGWCPKSAITEKIEVENAE